MHERSDQRLWIDTDRPGERLAVSLPMPGVRVRSVVNSNRHCVELHEMHTLCLLHAGQAGIGAQWYSGRAGKTLETSAGGIMVTELGEVHRTTRVQGKVAYSVVQIDPGVVRSLSEQLGVPCRPRVRATSVSSVELQAAMLRFVDAAAQAHEPFALECLLVDVTRAWLRTCSEDGVPRDPVVHRGIRRARDALRDHAACSESALECPRLDALAALSGLSPARFPHAFKEWLGISPHAYFNVSRLAAARRRLEQGESATRVAASFGYADLPHFSRHFRRQFGVSPRGWAKLAGQRQAVALS